MFYQYNPPIPLQGAFQPAVPLQAVQQPPANPSPAPDDSIPKVIQYLADSSGCGMYRCGWMSHLMNYEGKGMIIDSCMMITDPRIYQHIHAIRLQRQASSPQKEFVKFLKSLQGQYNFKLIYEVDDVVFREDIPDYNKFKHAFTSDEIRNNIQEIITMCDEVTVTCDFMKQLYTHRTGKKEITVIPNFPAKFWIGNYYNPERIVKLYDTYKRKPRILYAGSGAHFDVDGLNKGEDDFSHVIQNIIDTRHKYQWVFIGSFPPALHRYIVSKEIEFHPWQTLYKYPQKIYDLEIQMMVAPLQDNNFNRSKSDLKYIEACLYGLPVACQDMVTYQEADIKFKTGAEMIESIEKELKSSWDYKRKIRQRREVGEARFLEHDQNLDCYVELFKYPYGDPRRKNLKRWNK